MSGCYDIHSPERQALHFADLRCASHVKWHKILVPDLGALPYQNYAKWFVPVDTLVNQSFVAWLKYVELELHPGEEHRIEWK
jgi:hypothetical protein